jgi:glycosyltransferase involved in cell wall biosynthesis
MDSEVNGDPRFALTGPLTSSEVRAWLRRTRVFVSGCETEALGIGYLEALSQGCNVVMPACGGGIEIAPSAIGTAIHLYAGSKSRDVADALRRGLPTQPADVPLDGYSPSKVAEAYLKEDARFFSCLSSHREVSA